MSAVCSAAGPGRVLALVTDGFGTDGGIARYNAELLGALAALGSAEVRVLARRGAPCGELPRALVLEPARAARARYAGAALARALAHPFDWVFCGHVAHLPLARAAAALGGARLWLQLHGIEAWRRPGRALRRAAVHADLVTAVSRATRHRFLGWAGIHPSRVRVLSNTYAPCFRRGPRPRRLRRELSPEGGPVILTVSRLDAAERYKGHEQVMQALALLAAAPGPPPVYVIVGGGDDRARLESRARELGVARAVRFLGRVPASELPDVYRAADVFAMPSSGEGFGIVFLEAAACGLPIVAGNDDGARDALRDGLLGTLVDARDPHAIAGAIRRAIGHPPPAPALEVFARARFREHLARILAACPAREEGERWM